MTTWEMTKAECEDLDEEIRDRFTDLSIGVSIERDNYGQLVAYTDLYVAETGDEEYFSNRAVVNESTMFASITTLENKLREVFSNPLINDIEVALSVEVVDDNILVYLGIWYIGDGFVYDDDPGAPEFGEI